MTVQPGTKRAGDRLTRYSIFWLILVPTAIGYEVWAIVTGKAGGALSQVVWWAYGDRGSARWWLIGWATTGFLWWLPAHFLYRTDWRALAVLVAIGLAIGVGGWLVTK